MIWCQLTGVPWAVQRAIFQPVILAVFAMTAVGLGVGGAITAELVKLFLLGLVPVWLDGSDCTCMAGSRSRFPAASILAMLLLSGLVLLVPTLR